MTTDCQSCILIAINLNGFCFIPFSEEETRDSLGFTLCFNHCYFNWVDDMAVLKGSKKLLLVIYLFNINILNFYHNILNFNFSANNIFFI